MSSLTRTLRRKIQRNQETPEQSRLRKFFRKRGMKFEADSNSKSKK